MRLLLATENQGKLREMRTALPDNFEIVLPSELGIIVDVEETGETFEENARIKAENACRLSGLPAVADDSGLCVDALGGAPGVASKRFGPSELQRNEMLLEILGDTEQRSAKFVSVVVCRFPNGDELSASGECSGEIMREMRGANGFG
ncbi:MAG: non-canonical purine NTP pyrophosphatase, partial [Clostridiales bacterium]|nr:non-canonical purine NTP pyrophosphatase [Clostridiales bacterium]